MDVDEKKLKQGELREFEMKVRMLRKELNLKSGSGRGGTFIIAIIALLVAFWALISDLIPKEEIPTDIVTIGSLDVIESVLAKRIDALEEKIKEMKPGKTVGLDKATEGRLAYLEQKEKWHMGYIIKLQKAGALAKLGALGKPPITPPIISPPDDDIPPPDDGKRGQEVTLKVEASQDIAQIFFNRTWNDEGYRSGSNPVFEGVPPSTYRVNAENDAGLWSADAASLAQGLPHFEVTVSGTRMVKMEDNGEGGANFVFTINPDGSISPE